LAKADRNRIILPHPLDLRDIKVAQWNIYDHSKATVSRVDAYTCLAKTDDRFRRRTWLSLERALRDRGHAADADKLFRRMERQGENEARNDAIKSRWAIGNFLVWLFKWLFFRKTFDILLGYGTAPVRLFTIIVVFWIVALPFYMVPENFEPSLAMLGAEEVSFAEPFKKPKAETKPDEWSWVAGAAYSLRHHIPVVAIAPRNEWTLRETGRLCLGSNWSWVPDLSQVLSGAPKEVAISPVEEPSNASSPCLGPSISGSPEDWGLIVTILNFIAWPFVLAFAINRFLRIRQD